jgi:hypothetical protein
MRNAAAMTALTAFSLLLSAAQFSAQAAGCSKVGPSDKISINSVSQAKLAIGITRNLIFKALQDVSIPETSGCWAGTTGNFDGQIISAGVLQWNYGQESLQPALIAFRNQFATTGAYKDELARLMPTYGNLIFSSGCLRRDITDDCQGPDSWPLGSGWEAPAPAQERV